MTILLILLFQILLLTKLDILMICFIRLLSILVSPALQTIPMTTLEPKGTSTTLPISIFSSKDFVTASRTESNASSVLSSYSILFVSAELVSGIFSFGSFSFLLIFSSKTPADFLLSSLIFSSETSSDFMVSSIALSTSSVSFSFILLLLVGKQ